MAPHNSVTQDARTDEVTSFQKWFRWETRHQKRCRFVGRPERRRLQYFYFV